MDFRESLSYVVMAVAGRKQQNLNQCESRMGNAGFFPRQNCKPSKWQPIYGICNVLAARRVIPKTVDQVTGMQFFHSGPILPNFLNLKIIGDVEFLKKDFTYPSPQLSRKSNRLGTISWCPIRTVDVFFLNRYLKTVNLVSDTRH